ncbi:hypothetical protein SNE40_023289 [Patella caerulea]|uniref:G-protein coupled receptors family 1 profile domain-containing protein n=1 Tax=Patella caerulea TaxID=87958 RepID=A0AAN8G2M1_PATCE
MATMTSQVTEMTTTNMTFGNDSDFLNSTESPPMRIDQEIRTIKIAVQSVIFYLALFGNLFVLIVLKLRKQKLSRMQWFIVHLSLTDIFVAIFNTMTNLIQDITIVFQGNDFLCRSVKYFQVVAMYASSYVLIMTAVDRYVSICHPLTSQTMSPNRGHLMVLGAWVISLLFASPQIYIFRYIPRQSGVWDCSDHSVMTENWMYQVYVTWIFISIYAVPFIVLSVCYGRICHVVWSSARSKNNLDLTASTTRRTQSKKGPLWRISFKNNDANSMTQNDEGLLKKSSVNPRGHSKAMSKSKVKTVKVTLIVVICYLVCWAPFFIAQMWWIFDPNAPTSSWAFMIVVLLASLNSCTNPWIYLAFTGNMCVKPDKHRRISRSWTASTNLMSTSESDSRPRSTRSSYYDMSQRSSREFSSLSRDAITSHC